MPLNTPVQVALGLRRDRELDMGNLHYGIELEYENMSNPARTPEFWNTTGDGSLRNNGIEFVSTVLQRCEVMQAIDSVRDFLQGTRADPSPRCGIHVHLNMRGRTLGEMFSFITAYVLLEPSIFRHYCPNRVTSSFCVPVVENTNLIRALHGAVQRSRRRDHRPLSALVNTSKYSAVNMSSLRNFGTVEFRALPATLDFRLLRRWITTLTWLYDASTRYTEPTRVVALYDGLGLSGFQDTFLNMRVEGVTQREQNRAYAAGSIVAGHEEPTWEQYTWDIPLRTEVA